MARFLTQPPIRSGMPLGGVGAGSIELRPDGEFHEWQIHNPQIFSRDCRDIPQADKGEALAGGLSFYLLADSGAGPVLRRLGMGFGSGQGVDEEEYNYRMYSFNKPVQQIAYDARFPVARLRYDDAALPLSVSLSAVAPFTPYDERTAGTPGFYLTFTLRNDGAAPVSAALAGKLRNPLQGERRNVFDLSADGQCGALTMDVPGDRDAGSLSLRASGADITSLPGDFRRYMNEYVSIGEFGVVEESFLFGLRRDGALPFHANAAISRPSLPREEDVPGLSDEEAARLLDAARAYGFARSILERNTIVDPTLTQTPQGRKRLLACVCKNAARLADAPWGDGALCASLTLAPGESRAVTFILAWYFPNLTSAGGLRVGHVYENWFDGAAAAAEYLAQRREDILSRAHALSDALYDASFPELFSDAVSAQLANLVKSAWWTKDDQFAVWEGLGSCGFHTTDITYHGSGAIVTLFPGLQKRQMDMGARFQRADGRVHHFFTPDFSQVDDGFDRVDMNPQFVLLVCRDYFATGDTAYLDRMWPHVVRAMDASQALDADGDGLPDRDVGRNTYDSWHFSGVSTYISVLWLSALRAAAALAGLRGETARQEAWLALAQRGRQAVDTRLFNGSYYDLWTDGEQSDGCCMTDQLDGEYFSRLIGLGGVLDEGHVRTALESIYRLNYSAENGLVNAQYPAGKAPTVFTYRNCQGLANWSGIEYMMAAFYLLMGDKEKGLAIVQTVQERYARLGEIFNHAECGDHYYRAMSSWALLEALSGMHVNVALGRVALRAPRSGSLRAPWFTAKGYGSVAWRDGTWTIECRCGALDADEATLDGQSRPLAIHLRAGERIVIAQ